MSRFESEELIAALPRRARRGPGKKPRFLAVDFFCGAGGTTRGLIDAGGYVIAGVDKDSRCLKTFVANNGNETLDREYPTYLNYDIFPSHDQDYPVGEQATIFRELDELIPRYRADRTEVPLLFAICAPCQPFTTLSKAELSEGRKAMRARDRGLLAEACKFVARYQPEMILSENVAGIKDPRYGGVWDEFIECLESLGYVTGSQVVCTSDFGVPQFRRRSILLAARKESLNDPTIDLPVPTADPDAEIVPVSRALQHLPRLEAGQRHATIPNHATRGLNELNKKRISFAKPGESNLYLDTTPAGDLSLACHRRVNKRQKVRCFTDVYTRMAPDRPSPTMTTRCHSITNGRFGHYDTKQLRGISMREAACLQSFEDDYIFYPEHQIEPIARMIGNAVPPKLARFFAKYLSDCVTKDASKHYD